jgi:hypothetical protein
VVRSVVELASAESREQSRGVKMESSNRAKRKTLMVVELMERPLCHVLQLKYMAGDKYEEMI